MREAEEIEAKLIEFMEAIEATNGSIRAHFPIKEALEWVLEERDDLEV